MTNCTNLLPCRDTYWL